MEDNVVRMPDAVERLLMEINGHLTKADEYRKAATKNREGWCSEIVAICETVAALRNQFTADIHFGKRVEESGIKLNKNERAACIAMGREIELTKKVLTTTKSWSVEGIYEEEFRFQSVLKPKKADAKGRLRAPTRKALDAIKQARAEGKRFTSQSALAKEIGVSETAVRRAAVIDQLTEEVEVRNIDLSTLTKVAQSDITAYKKQLDRENEAKLREMVTEEVEELLSENFRILFDKITVIEGALKRKHPFTGAEFKQLLRVCHPDNSASDDVRSAVFRMLKDYEATLRPDAATELADQARELRGKVMALQQKKILAWREANGGKVRIPPDAMNTIIREAKREAGA